MSLAGDNMRSSRAKQRSFWLVTASMVLFGLTLTACQQSATPLPAFAGGVYTSAPYHFSITYPNGWKANAQSSTSAVVPLTVYITRSDAVNTPGDPISTLSIAVFNVHDANIAKSVKSLATDKTLRTTRLASLAAYASAPIQQQVPGSTITDTHTDYYLVTTDWEYQISTDAISGENADAALQSMVASFALTK
ncbi:MAG TPA: hypothetical protein VKQ30_06525 [Ktedonobacterales bacterium]|nr:hypothetical protein [Ktedonobacterales bacterium]